MARITIDKENNAEEFWNAVNDRDDIPNAIAVVDCVHSVSIVTDNRTAKTVEEWCSLLPGWNNGPEHAPHPLVFDYSESA